MELKDLEKQVEKGVSGLIGHDSALQELAKVREDLQKERDTQKTQLLAIQGNISEYQEAMTKLLQDKEQQDNQIHGINDVMAEKLDLLDKEKRRKEYWEKELKSLKSELLSHHSLIKTNDSVLYQSQLAIQRLDEQLHEQKSLTERAIKEYENINKKTQKYQHDLEAEIERTSAVKAENQNLQAQLRVKENDAASQKQELAKSSKLRDTVQRRNRLLEQQRSEVEHERNTLQLEIQKMEADISGGRKACESDRKQIDDLTRERDILNKNYLKAQGGTQKQKDWLLIKENQRRNLEQEIRGYEKHGHKQREQIYHLEQETLQYEKEASEALSHYVKSMDEVRILESKVDESQRAIHDSEHKLKQQQGLFEQVLNERNLYSKNLLELHSDIQDMRRKFKIMNHSILQLKEEIQQKEKDLVHHNIQKSKLESEKKRYLVRKQKFVTMIDANTRKILSLANEINKLNEIINEADSEKAKQKRDYENVMNERDILGAQLIKRNDELSRLYERIRIQQSTMNKGDIQYRDRMLELRQLKEKSSQLGIELNSVKSFISKIDDLKLEINIKTNALTKERAKVKALTDELQNPLNVHRWHKMEGSEPQTYEARTRTHKLQKQLIVKTEEVHEKERLIAEKEKLYVELKGILARQPGPEVAEQLNVYKDNLSKKTSQMKAMQVSLCHFQDQVKRFQSEYDDIQAEFSTMHTTYFKERRQVMREDEHQRKVQSMMNGVEGAAATVGANQPGPYKGHSVGHLANTDPGPVSSPPADAGSGDAALPG
eukprot:TRINITY_DN10670_c0_g1_i1.p1 TRINITY_DN10670_c0_g1~~TRINITY_DN10670_c0_g1_i1.p1  ORF type:complete len:774 (+),score=182.79 TRINITY_DN10670_c0_g1_i1:475-2796(+)